MEKSLSKNRTTSEERSKMFHPLDVNRRPINVSLSLRITRSRPVEAGICTCTKRDDRRVRLIRNKSISRPVDCRLDDSTAIQLTVSSWLSNNTRSFDEDEPRQLTYTTRQRDYTRSTSGSIICLSSMSISKDIPGDISLRFENLVWQRYCPLIIPFSRK